MKVLLLLLVVLAGVLLWRNRQVPPPMPKPNPPKDDLLNMVRCARCSTHVPANEAVTGVKGQYCCQEHRQQSEQ
ncbi:PP0621 family protein [Rhodoferax sp.]|uniref:PP0621 family protein n=1 Tax=Rhodoferax sp. TaxID=50421 RepID=UPI002619A739|nr:PP0621 family protein [Rhodoferax sp.]MDD2810155.1 PP0621 family protein [Rhodoferax sp.]MDD4945099.1 PP0621 family protein [Rhodoferax sp.]MDD5478473.1 PP0621 family protein [Rhodoferax sp.]